MDLLSITPGRCVRSVAAAAFAVAATCGRGAAQRLTQDEALRLAFPAADTVERRTAYLDDGQLARANELAGPEPPVEGSVVTYYVATAAGEPVGAAYFDVHRVRTLPEVLMVVVGKDARIRRVEVIRFSEPPEYRARPVWLGQFDGRRLDSGLSLKGDITPITGATLTSRAATAAMRRVLALHRVIAPFGEAAP